MVQYAPLLKRPAIAGGNIFKLHSTTHLRYLIMFWKTLLQLHALIYIYCSIHPRGYTRITPLKNRKTAGSDDIAPELLTFAEEPVSEALHKLFVTVNGKQAEYQRNG